MLTTTIAYVKCTDPEDEHFEALQKMEDQLKTFRTLSGEPYRLLALPMADKIVFRWRALARYLC